MLVLQLDVQLEHLLLLIDTWKWWSWKRSILAAVMLDCEADVPRSKHRREFSNAFRHAAGRVVLAEKWNAWKVIWNVPDGRGERVGWQFALGAIDVDFNREEVVVGFDCGGPGPHRVCQLEVRFVLHGAAILTLRARDVIY
ncbi:MAG: hypothetical protein JOZ87_11500 [Chloroflexi bacterium]|nr:hypothetical protein [Chloroflexota bacterium]